MTTTAVTAGTDSCPAPQSIVKQPYLDPCGDWMYVELTAPERVLPSGIVLPETAVENHTEARVLNTGIGVYWHNHRYVYPSFLGDGAETVYFPKHAFQGLDGKLAGGKNRGFVRDRDAIAGESDYWSMKGIQPLNDWLMLKRCPGAGTIGSIVLPQRARKPAHCGILVEWGNGVPVTTGPLGGCRRPVHWDLGCPAGEPDEVWPKGFRAGAKVYWDPLAKRVLISQADGGDPYVFIRARDALAFEPSDPDDPFAED